MLQFFFRQMKILNVVLEEKNMDQLLHILKFSQEKINVNVTTIHYHMNSKVDATSIHFRINLELITF